MPTPFKRFLLPSNKSVTLISLLSILTPFFILSGNVQALTLAELQASAQQHLQQAQQDSTQQRYAKLSSWLAGGVSLQASAMQSNQSLGTDEYEVGLFVPINSPTARTTVKQQNALTMQLTEALDQRFALFTSGLIREALWQRVMAQKSYDLEQQKQAWLAQQLADNKIRFEAGELTQVAWSQWQLQALYAERAFAIAEAKLEQAVGYYRDVTGTDELPEQFIETPSDDPMSVLNRHPDLVLLRLSMQQATLALNASSHSASPWTVGMVARQLRGPSGNENLVGVSVDIPLSIGNENSQADVNDWQTSMASMQNALTETQLALLQQLKQSQRELTQVQYEVQILERQVALSQAISQQQQQQQGEVAQQLIIQSLLEQQNLTQELALANLKIAEIKAKINQISGKAL